MVRLRIFGNGAHFLVAAPMLLALLPAHAATDPEVDSTFKSEVIDPTMITGDMRFYDFRGLARSKSALSNGALSILRDCTDLKRQATGARRGSRVTCIAVSSRMRSAAGSALLRWVKYRVQLVHRSTSSNRSVIFT